MSSDSEMSEFSDMSGNPEDEDVEEGNDEDYDVIYSEITPYQDEPQEALNLSHLSFTSLAKFFLTWKSSSIPRWDRVLFQAILYFHPRGLHAA